MTKLKVHKRPRQETQPASPWAKVRCKREGVLAGVTVTAVTLLSVLILSNGTVTDFQTRSPYYGWLADAFINGQTFLLIPPPPELTRLPDPYDPAANRNYRMQDASLYQNHFYFYFGPVPALLLIPIKAVFLPPLALVGDEWVVLGFMILLSVSVAILLVWIKRDWYRFLPSWTVLPPLLCTLLSAPVVWLVRQGSVYEAAICGGQAFVFLGLLFAYRGLKPPLRAPWLLLAGLCWAAAVGCRWSLGPAVAAVAMITLLQLSRSGRPDALLARRTAAASALLAPLAGGAVGLALYNHIRFGSFTETGASYQLMPLNIHGLMGSGKVFGARYILPNAYRYLLELPRLKPAFPFLFARAGVHGLVKYFPPFVEHPLEPVAGVLWSMPFVLLAIPFLARLLGGSAFWHAPLQRGQAGTTTESLSPDLMRWLGWSLVLFAVLGFAPALLLIYSTERYLGDAAPAAMMLGGLGSWVLLARHLSSDGRGRRAARFWIVGASALTVVISFLLLCNPPY